MGGLGRFTRWTLSACLAAVLLVSLVGRASAGVQGKPVEESWRMAALDLVIHGGFSVPDAIDRLSIPGEKVRFCAKSVYRWIKSWELYATSTS